MRKKETNSGMRGMKEKTYQRWQRFVASVFFAVMLSTVLCIPVLADDTMIWLTPFENLVNTFYAAMTLCGKCLLGWAVFEITTALFSHDTSQVPLGLRRIIGGCLLVFVEPIVNAMSATPSTEVSAAVSTIASAIIGG